MFCNISIAWLISQERKTALGTLKLKSCFWPSSGRDGLGWFLANWGTSSWDCAPSINSSAGRHEYILQPTNYLKNPIWSLQKIQVLLIEPGIKSWPLLHQDYLTSWCSACSQPQDSAAHPKYKSSEGVPLLVLTFLCQGGGFWYHRRGEGGEPVLGVGFLSLVLLPAWDEPQPVTAQQSGEQEPGWLFHPTRRHLVEFPPCGI